MSNAAKSKLLVTVNALIAEGEQVNAPAEAAGGGYLETRVRSRWSAGCRHLLAMLGNFGKPYDTLKADLEHLGHGRALLGTLEALRRAVESDLLVSAEELIRAELFDDLLEQADYLLSKSYDRAAAVLGRAVLEEHLRKWCDKANCKPVMPKPTQMPSLADYNQGLYKATVIDKLVMKQVDLMAVVGNDAAHNNPIKRDDVERMLKDVRDFLTRNPV